MTDPTAFDIDLTVTQPLSHKPQPELYAFDDCKTYRLPERKLLIRNPNNGKTAVIMPEVLTALAQCTKFASIEDHIETVRKAIPQLRGHPGQIRQVVDSMVRDGMMVSARSLCDAFNAVKVEDDPVAGEPAVVAIITCDRPQAVERLLGSIEKHGDPAGFERLYLIDDSRDAENMARNRAAVDAFNRESTIDTVYFGRERQRALMDEMIARSPEHEASIRFLVDFERWKDEWTGGLARNYALLLSKGKRLVMLDDDVLFQVYEPQPRPSGINLRDEIREAEFFDEIGDWPGLKLRPELDPVKAHLYCLGLPLRQAMRRLGVERLEPRHLGGCAPGEIRRLTADQPVLATQCGSLGEPGVGNNRWIIELTGESRRKMLASDESVARAIKNDNAWIGRRQPHIAQRSNMSAITGLDNRQALPPYFPVQRGEDRLFGHMLGACFPNGAALDYPWAAPHLAVGTRDKPSVTKGSNSIGLIDLVTGWMLAQDSKASRALTASRASGASHALNALSSMAPESFAELVADLDFQGATRDMTDFARGLSGSGRHPEPWQAFLRAELAKMDRVLGEKMRQAPGSGDQPAIGTDTANSWQAMTAAFAQALVDWTTTLRRAP